MERLKAALEVMDHPMLFLFAMTLGVFAIANLIYWAATNFGWTGIAMFFR